MCVSVAYQFYGSITVFYTLAMDLYVYTLQFISHGVLSAYHMSQDDFTFMYILLRCACLSLSFMESVSSISSRDEEAM